MSIFPSARRDNAKGGKVNPSPIVGQVLGIVLVTIGLLLFLSLLSFVPEDPLLFFGGSDFRAPDVQVPPHNLVGIVGATLGFLLFAMIGGAAYLVPFFLVGSGVRAMLGEEFHIKYRNVIGSILAVLSLSALFQFRLSSVPILGDGIVAPGMAGGLGGQWIAQFLEPYFANIGSHIVLLAGLLVSLLLISPTTVVATVRRAPQVLKVSVDATRALLPKPKPEGEKVKPIKPNKSVKINRSATIRGGVGNLGAASIEEDKLPAIQRRNGGEEENSVEEDSTEEKEDIPILLDHPEPPVRSAVAKNYRLPSPVELLSSSSQRPAHQTDAILETQSQILTQTLFNFGIEGKVTEVHPGPVITMYEFAPGPGIKVARIVSLADDLAMALKALRVRVVAPLPEQIHRWH